MKTIIHWKKYNQGQSLGSRWYVAILKPANFKELDINSTGYKDWINQFGFNLVWANENRFWQDHQDITERVLYYAKRPEKFMKE